MKEVRFPLHFPFSAYVRGATRTNLPFLHLGRTHVLGKFMIM